MVSTAYSEAAVEVLDILKHTRDEDVNKIPRKFIEFLENNKSETYSSKLDHSKTIKEMSLKPKTEALLGLIYLKYWANEEEKSSFKKAAKEREIKYQQELKEKYNPDNLFENKKVVTEQEKIKEEAELPIVQKKTVIQKIMNRIKSIFERKN